MYKESSVAALIYYYMRDKYYGTALQHCQDAINQFHDNHEFVCLKAFCLAKLGRTPEAIRLLSGIKKTSLITLGVNVTLQIVYLSEKNIDQESVDDTERKITEEWSSADIASAYVAGLVLYFDGNHERARSLLDNYTDASGVEPKIVTLKGWLDLATEKDAGNAQKHFDLAIESYEYLDAYFGQVRIQRDRQNVIEMQDILNLVLDQNSSHLPAYIELIHASIMLRDWNKVFDLSQSASLIQSNDCIPIQICECAKAILIQGDTIQIDQLLTELFDSVQRVENGNGYILNSIAHFLMTLSVDANVVKQYARKFNEEALTCSNNVAYICEKSRQLFSDGDYKEAYKTARLALENNYDTNSEAIFVIIRYYLTKGNIQDAKDQMEFLEQTNAEIQKTVMYYFVRALINKMQGCATEVFLAGVKQAVDAHLSVLQHMPFGLKYIECLDPAFLLEVCQSLFEVAPLTPAKAQDPVLKEILKIVALVYDNCPGFGKFTYLYAKAKYLETDSQDAEKMLKQCMGRSSCVSEAYLLLAQILLQKHQLIEASKCLDSGLGFNFQVRDHPLYYLIKARMIKEENKSKMSEAIDMLKSALKLKAFNDPKQAMQMDINESVRISIYLEMIDCYHQINRNDDADNIMKEALNRYKETPEEDRLVLMNAQLRLQRGDPRGAIDVLAQVLPDEPNYTLSRTKMAQIYLEELKDKIKYAACYREIVQNDQSIQNYVLLGDAYMSIQEPTKAIESYEAAMRRNPRDSALAEKIGNAYVECHLYHKAITFYETAMKTGKDKILRLRYAEELLRVKNYDKCERILMEAIDESADTADPSSTKHLALFWMLLAKVYAEREIQDEATKAMQKAKTLQIEYIASKQGTQNLAEEKKVLARIANDLAATSLARRDYAKAIDLYKEAIDNDPKDIKSMLELARVYYSSGKIQQCNQMCLAVLNGDRNNNEATLIMADIMYQRSEGDGAMKHFAQLLERNPTQYHAMARCMELYWRKGEVENAEGLLRKAQDANPRANVDAGYNYCKGLHEWHTCDPNSALNYFNRARRDLEWGEHAIYNIVEIFLNPDYETLGEVSDAAAMDANQSEREINIKSAERFLNEVRNKPTMPNRFFLMENYVMIASGNRVKIQNALNNLLELIPPEDADVTDKPINVGALLGVARGYLYLKQPQKAKQHLKRLINYPWSLEYADYLERCWLMLTDIYISQNKHDHAISILRTTLQYNSSSIKAFEYMGYVHERQQEFPDAAANYEFAWRLGKGRNPAIGFKLAFNYLKCKKCFECIDICLNILRSHPDYPRIRQEILDKARMSIMGP